MVSRKALLSEKIAKEFPDTRFAIIDTAVNAPNVLSIEFKEHEGSFLVGMLAAMASNTEKVGFVGGMDIPLIRRFVCGYEQGVKYVNPAASVIQNMTATKLRRLGAIQRAGRSLPKVNLTVVLM